MLSTAFKWGNNFEDITHRKPRNRLSFVLSVHNNSLVKCYYLSYTSKKKNPKKPKQKPPKDLKNFCSSLCDLDCGSSVIFLKEQHLVETF